MLEAVTSSGELAVGTTVVCAVPGLIYSVLLHPAAAGCSVKIYDNATAASGTILMELVAPASASSVSASLVAPIFSTKGLTAVVAGSGAVAHILFSRSF